MLIVDKPIIGWGFINPSQMQYVRRRMRGARSQEQEANSVGRNAKCSIHEASCPMQQADGEVPKVECSALNVGYPQTNQVWD
jgi:hypothetical protein